MCVFGFYFVVFDFFLGGWHGCAVNENENWSTTSMVCCLLWHYKCDGVSLDGDSPFFKAISPKTGKFSNTIYKFDQELKQLWKQVAASNNLDAGDYGGMFFVVWFIWFLCYFG